MEKNIQISGMHCHHCVNAVTTALENLDDVEVVRVDIGSASVFTQTDDEKIVATIVREGYAVDSIT